MPSDLTDMEFDEISFVPKGANQKADVVLFKSAAPDAQLVSEGYDLVTRRLAQVEVLRRHQANLVLAERAEARLEQLRNTNAGATYEQAVSTVLNEDPSLYQP
jgi:hypothetical protein